MSAPIPRRMKQRQAARDRRASAYPWRSPLRGWDVAREAGPLDLADVLHMRATTARRTRKGVA